MQFSLTVQLLEGEQFPLDQDEAARIVFEALGGDPNTDTCMVYIAPPVVAGIFGLAATAPGSDPGG